MGDNIIDPDIACTGRLSTLEYYKCGGVCLASVLGGITCVAAKLFSCLYMETRRGSVDT